MKLYVDTSKVSFTVTKASEPKKDQEGRQRANKETGELLWNVQAMALDESGGTMVTITLAGAQPKVTVGQQVHPVELEAIPWATNGRSGVAFRAKELKPVASSKAA